MSDKNHKVLSGESTSITVGSKKLIIRLYVGPNALEYKNHIFKLIYTDADGSTQEIERNIKDKGLTVNKYIELEFSPLPKDLNYTLTVNEGTGENPMMSLKMSLLRN